MKKQFIIIMASVLTLVVSGQVMAETQYTITNLGNFTVKGINDSGQAVGTSWENGMPQGIIWQNGSVTHLGNLQDHGQVYANTINNIGDVAGHAWTVSGDNADAFLWKNGHFTILGTLGGTHTAAYGINDSGKIVGHSLLGDGYSGHAFLWDSGKMTDLGMGEALSINNKSQITGYNGNTHAVLWQNDMSIIDLGTLGGKASWGKAINETGQIVGESYITGDSAIHAFLWQDETMEDIGILPGYIHSVALGINDIGQVVGKSEISIAGQLYSEAFLWQDGKMTDLGMGTALAINNNGWIVGQIYEQAVLWKPIPEPATLLLLGFGAVMLRKKHKKSLRSPRARR
jgi:probable HAF family extracellular repeat protein